MFVLQSLIIGLVTTLTVWFVRLQWNRRHLYRIMAKIPGPKGYPFIGVAHRILGKDAQGVFKGLMDVVSEFETPNKFWAGHLCFVNIDKPEDLKIVLNSPHCLNKASVYNIVPMQTGLLVSGDDLWKKHRKLINPSFYVKVLQSFIPVFNQKSKVMIKCMERYLNKGEFDAFHHMSAFTLETLLSTSIGLEKDIQSEPQNSSYLHSVEMGAEILSQRIFKIWLHYKPLYIFTKLYQLEKEHVINGMMGIGDDIIKEKTIQHKLASEKVDENNNENLEQSTEFDSDKPQIFIDQLFNLKDLFTQQEIKDEINTIIAAGHETSALTLSAALLMMAMHQDVQEKVLQETEEVVGSSNENVDYEMLNQLTYMEMVIKECMRLFPVLPVIGRHCSNDVELEKCVIPAGATVMINIFNAQRNTNSWGEDAHLFNPERFSTENISKVHPYAFIPFSGGPRICIGLKYAMNVMKIILVHFIRNYKLTTSLKYEELQMKIAISLKIAQKYMIKIERRNLIN